MVEESVLQTLCKQQLLQRRDELSRLVLAELQEINANEEEHHLADMVDVRSAWDEDAALRVIELEGNELEQIEWALERLEEGTYGVCDECDTDIDFERLQALPLVTTCIDCQRRLEAAPNV